MVQTGAPQGISQRVLRSAGHGLHHTIPPLSSIRAAARGFDRRARDPVGFKRRRGVVRLRLRLIAQEAPFRWRSMNLAPSPTGCPRTRSG